MAKQYILTTSPNVFKSREAAHTKCFQNIFRNIQVKTNKGNWDIFAFFWDKIDKTDYHIIHIHKFDYCVFKHKEIILFVKVPLATT